MSARAATKRAKPKSVRGASTRMPRTLTELMAQALVMENEAAQRYADLADAMETHNNRGVAELFRKMAVIERKHAAQIMAEMGWKEAPPLPKVAWEDFEAPETAPADAVHYLMTPYHALEIALANEKRAERFFTRLVRMANVESVRKAARELMAEEREHVALVTAWLKKVPRPNKNWSEDPDPPSYTD